ncbi:hypothetical protein SVAN01_05896 [Stagonosporopsis vannaccii]|nr:hypothetical protein SVAN01_05896 [Stagonosporopsis vannaccii]
MCRTQWLCGPHRLTTIPQFRVENAAVSGPWSRQLVTDWRHVLTNMMLARPAAGACITIALLSGPRCQITEARQAPEPACGTLCLVECERWSLLRPFRSTGACVVNREQDRRLGSVWRRMACAQAKAKAVERSVLRLDLCWLKSAPASPNALQVGSCTAHPERGSTYAGGSQLQTMQTFVDGLLGVAWHCRPGIPNDKYW